MYRSFLTSIAFLLSVGISVAGPAEDCYPTSGDLFGDAVIKGCTAYIEQSRGDKTLLRQVYSKRGLLYFFSREYDLAIADYTKSIELGLDDAFHYHLRGAAYLKSGRAELSIADHTKAIELEPRNAGHYNERALAYLAARRAPQALVDAEKALALSPEKSDNSFRWHIVFTRALIFEALGRVRDAVSDYHSIPIMSPVFSESRQALTRLGAKPFP